MTERTLREQIAGLPRYMSDEIGMDRCPTGDWINRDAVLALLDAHTAEQPAPDAVAERPLPHIRFGVHSRPINPNDDR